MSFVLDTNVVLYLLGGHLDEPLPVGDYTVSVITELELLSYHGLTSEGEAIIRNFLADVKVVGLEPDIRASAIRLRKHQRLKLPDAIVAATADAMGATLLTCDGQLLRLASPPSRSLRLRQT